MKATAELVETRRSLALAAGLALLWAVLAIARPGVTYHLAPMIVAAVPPLAAGFEGRVRPPALARLAIAGVGLALGTTLLLSSIGGLAGPSLLPIGGAAAEAVIFGALGAIAGLVIGGYFGAAGNRPR